MINLKNIRLRRGAKVLLEGASVTIHAGEKVGLVGNNGTGKSSLFRLLDGQLHEDSGELLMPAAWRLAQVEQSMPESTDSATDFVLSGDAELMALRAQRDVLEREGDGLALAEQYQLLADAGDHDARARAEALILGLGFAVEALEQPVNSFSGGWRMRLQLARALICPSDLMLLDEPTNHLDLDALVWLEVWLKKYPGTLIVISHDREFLDAVTRVTLHIEQNQLTRYSGNYSAFEEMRSERMRLQQSAMDKQRDKIEHLQKFIDRFKAKASKAKQAQSRIKALERMERIAPVLASAEFSFEFREPDRVPNPLLTLQDADLGYQLDSGAPRRVLRQLSRTVQAGQRIGILGANGQGKSTLVKTLARQLAPLSGNLSEGKGLRIGYFAQQELDVLRPAESALEHMRRWARDEPGGGGSGSGEQALRGFLGGFLFSGEMVNQPVGSMSGGEKARLVLAMIVWQRPNLLLLDEPTNHLDLSAREALSVALNEFEGTVLLVSHDRALLRSVCDDFWLVSRGQVSEFTGDLDDYQNYLIEEARRQRESERELRAPPRRSGESVAARRPKSAGVNRQALKREFDRVEMELERLGRDRDVLEGQLMESQLPTERDAAGRSLKEVLHSMAELETRWIEMAEKMEQNAAS